MFKGHQFQNLKNSVKTKEACHRGLELKGSGNVIMSNPFVLCMGKLRPGRVRSPGEQRGIGKLFPPHSSQEVGAGL